MCPTPAETCGNKALGPSISATPTAQVKPLTRFLDVPSTLGNTWKHAGNKALGPFLPRWPQKLSPNTLPRCAQHPRKHVETSRKQGSRPVSATAAAQVKPLTLVRRTKGPSFRGPKARPPRGPGNCTGVPLQTIAAAVAVGGLCQGSNASRSEGKTTVQTLRVHVDNGAQLQIDRRRGEP